MTEVTNGTRILECSYRGVMTDGRQRKRLKAVMAAGLLLTALVFLGVRLRGSAPPPPPMAFFTTDEGRTVFVASVTRIPPFEHQGREAVRAMVYTCTQCRTQWVAYLIQYTPTAQGILRDAGQNLANLRFAFDAAGAGGGELVKRPGDTVWVPALDPRAENIRMGGCPNGHPIAMAQPVIPAGRRR